MTGSPARRRPTRRKAPDAPDATAALALCTGCHAYLAESLLGELRCPTPRCPNHGVIAGRVDAVLGRLGAVLGEESAA